MEKYTISSIDKEIEMEFRHSGEAYIEAQRKSDEWGQMIALKDRKGKFIRNFTPTNYRPR